MCEFISWIEKNDSVLFLTYNDIYNTRKGRELREFCKSEYDLFGHGAIRFYYGLENGVEKECTDFSTPDNFPPDIVDAIKKGLFAGLGVALELLTKSALSKYAKVRNLAYVKYEKVQKPAYTKYEKVRDSAYAEYVKVRDSAYARESAYAEEVRESAYTKYRKAQESALADYVKVHKPASAEYKKVRNAAFWKLFENPNNRNSNWR